MRQRRSQRLRDVGQDRRIPYCAAYAALQTRDRRLGVTRPVGEVVLGPPPCFAHQADERSGLTRRHSSPTLWCEEHRDDRARVVLQAAATSTAKP